MRPHKNGRYVQAKFRQASCLLICFCIAAVAQAAPQAICVPWQPASPSMPHYTFNGAQTTVKGIRAERDHQRGQFDFSNQIAIQQPAKGAKQQTSKSRNPDVYPHVM